MAYFQWEQKYDLGVAEMNQEHQVLIDIMNELYAANEAGKGKAEINKCIKALVDWTKTHFAHEEEFMAKIQFHGLKRHRLIHENLLQELDRHAQDYQQSSSAQISPKFFSFLKLWLQAHILGIDMQYGQHAKSA